MWKACSCGVKFSPCGFIPCWDHFLLFQSSAAPPTPPFRRDTSHEFFLLRMPSRSFPPVVSFFLFDPKYSAFFSHLALSQLPSPGLPPFSASFGYDAFLWGFSHALSERFVLHTSFSSVEVIGFLPMTGFFQSLFPFLVTSSRVTINRYLPASDILFLHTALMAIP